MDVLLKLKRCVWDLQHAFHDGRLEEVVLRHLDAEDGQTVIAKDIRYVVPFQLLKSVSCFSHFQILTLLCYVLYRLSDFLENMHI